MPVPRSQKSVVSVAEKRKGDDGTGRGAGSAEYVSEVIGRIYDCALDPGRWRDVLASITEEFEFRCSVLGIVTPNSVTQSVKAEVGIDAEWLAVGDSYAAEAMAIWGGPERAWEHPLDEPIVASQIPSYRDLPTNRYYIDILEPRGLVDTALITLARGSDLIGYVAFNRHVSQGLLSDDVVAALRLLGPHFRRAATISNLFEMKAVEVATFASVLDNFLFGILLVDENLNAVHANVVAQDMLTDRDLIRVDRSGLTVAQRSSHAALERAVHLAAVDPLGLGARGIGIPVRGEGDNSAVIHVLPLGHGELRRSFTQKAVAALFVTSTAAAPPPLPADALALLYDLTPAETRTLELLAAGMSRTAIGETLGIAPSTVKSHIVHLFDKTGCHRQADLVRLAAKVSFPVSVA